jgi:hypothetical protein
MNKSNTQLWKGQIERGNKTAGHFDIYIYTHEILWTLLTKYQTITFIMNSCDQLPVEFNKEQTSVPWTSVEFPKATGSLTHTHSWNKYVCLYICIYEIAEKPPQTESVSVKKKTNKCGHNLVGVTHRVSDHHLHDRLQSLAAITLHQLWMMGVDKTIINCSILSKQ